MNKFESYISLILLIFFLMLLLPLFFPPRVKQRKLCFRERTFVTESLHLFAAWWPSCCQQHKTFGWAEKGAPSSGATPLCGPTAQRAVCKAWIPRGELCDVRHKLPAHVNVTADSEQQICKLNLTTAYKVFKNIAKNKKRTNILRKFWCSINTNSNPSFLIHAETETNVFSWLNLYFTHTKKSTVSTDNILSSEASNEGTYSLHLPA